MGNIAARYISQFPSFPSVATSTMYHFRFIADLFLTFPR